MARNAGLSDHYVVDSAGLIDYHEGELPDARMRRHAHKHGYELTHRSRPIRSEDFSRFDLIVAMDHQNRQQLLRGRVGSRQPFFKKRAAEETFSSAAFLFF